MASDGSNNKIVYANQQQDTKVYIDQYGKSEIILSDNSNTFSMYYAMAHIFLNDLIEIAYSGGASSVAMQKEINADLQTLCKFAEIQRHKLPARSDGLEWQAVPTCGILTDEQLKTLYEVTSIAYIKYLMRGEAPECELESVFSSIKGTLKNESCSLPDINLSPEVVQVFDRMLATDSEGQSKKTVTQPVNSLTGQTPSPQSGICGNSSRRSTTVTKSLGRSCIGYGILFLIFGLSTQNGSALYNLENFHGIMMLVGTILFSIGGILYLGMANRLFSWKKTEK